MVYLSRLVQATQIMIDGLGLHPLLDPLHEFFQYLELEYMGIHRD
jgi:hypothetical protein